MASYRGHLAFSTALGAAYGVGAWWLGGMDWTAAVLGGTITSISGMLPDLDSDSGVPVRALFGLLAVLAPVLLMPRILAQGLPLLQMILLIFGIGLFIRYPLAAVFKRCTVHRGMFHSIPGMFIAGLAVLVCYHNPDIWLRVYLAVGCMIGFLSHLVLDELCSVGIDGAKITLNKAAGSAVKLFSASFPATVVAYLMLGCLTYVAWPDLETVRDSRFVNGGWRVAGSRALEKVGITSPSKERASR